MIYLDHHAATPPCPEAVVAMRDALAHGWANPASVHRAGRASRRLLELARDQLAAATGAQSSELVWTSGGTEACNLGVLGLLPEPAGCRVVASAIEHPAVERAVDELVRRGARVTRLAAPNGRVPAAEVLRECLQEERADLLVVQWVNHETGTLWPIHDYGEVCAEFDVPFFVDGTQALGKVAIDLRRLPVTALAVAAHKMGGPAGVGALFVRRGTALRERMLGGGQERGRRAGTPGVPEIAGFGAACAVLEQRLRAMPRLAVARDHIERALSEPACADTPRGRVNGAGGPRVATVTNISFSGVLGAEVVAALDLEGLCVASGAACSSGVSAPSPVLAAMYPAEPERAKTSVRISFSGQDADFVCEDVVDVIVRVLRRMSGLCF